MTGVRSQQWQGFSFCHRVQTGYRVQRASNSTVTGALFPGVNRPGREAGYSVPSSAKIKNSWSYTSTPPYVFMAWCLVNHEDNFTFTSNFSSYSITRAAIALYGVLLASCSSHFQRKSILMTSSRNNELVEVRQSPNLVHQTWHQLNSLYANCHRTGYKQEMTTNRKTRSLKPSTDVMPHMLRRWDVSPITAGGQPHWRDTATVTLPRYGTGIKRLHVLKVVR
jgi:hypothetical protein